MQEKTKYIICPRCELNYIKEQDELCNVCKAELGLLGKNYLIPEDELEAESGKLCPICHVNYIDEDEEMCIICKKVKEAKEQPEDLETSWKAFVDEPEEEVPPEEISLELAAEEEEEQEEEEEIKDYKEVSDFNYDIDPRDFEVEEDEEEEEDDEDDDI